MIKSKHRRERTRTAVLASALQAALRALSSPAGLFLARYVVYTTLLFLLPAIVTGVEHALVDATLQSLAMARFLTPFAVSVSGDAISIGSASIRIVLDCTPLHPSLLLFGGILAFPGRWRDRIVGLLIGAAILWAYNLMRVYLLMWVLRSRPEWFDLVHIYLWQSVTILVVLGMFLTWVRIRSPMARAK